MVMGTYKLPLGSDPASKLDQLKRGAAQRRIRFEGTLDQGSFSRRGSNGYYRREGECIIVTITKTPFFISESAVVDQIKNFLTH
jgi:hypothetical protein